MNTETLPSSTELLAGKLVAINSDHKFITTNSLKVAKHFGKRASNVNQTRSKIVCYLIANISAGIISALTRVTVLILTCI